MCDVLLSRKNGADSSSVMNNDLGRERRRSQEGAINREVELYETKELDIENFQEVISVGFNRIPWWLRW